MIREATIDDMPELLRMGAEFADSVDIPLDRDSAIKTGINLINSESSVILIGDGAMAGAVLFPMFFNADVLAAQELFWWVDKDKRSNGVGLAVLDALESWAIKAGAKRLTMLALSDTSPEYIDSVYIDSGYVPLEKTFVKVF